MTKTTIHITEQYPPYKVRNAKTFSKEHSAHLKTRKVLLIDGKHTQIEVLSVMNQQFKEIDGIYHFTCDMQIKYDIGEEE